MGPDPQFNTTGPDCYPTLGQKVFLFLGMLFKKSFLTEMLHQTGTSRPPYMHRPCRGASWCSPGAGTACQREVPKCHCHPAWLLGARVQRPAPSSRACQGQTAALQKSAFVPSTGRLGDGPANGTCTLRAQPDSHSFIPRAASGAARLPLQGPLARLRIQTIAPALRVQDSGAPLAPKGHVRIEARLPCLRAPPAQRQETRPRAGSPGRPAEPAA